MNSIRSNIYELNGPKDLCLRSEILDFTSIADHEIIGETIYSAVSPGTEIAAYRGASPLRPGKIYPRLVGYCNVARVVHVGQKVAKYHPGDCILSFQSHRSSFKANEDDFGVLLENGVNLKYAATAYLFHLGYHGLITADARAGHNIGVIGIGTLGYTTSIMSNLIGAQTFAFTNQESSIALLDKQSVPCFKKSADVLSDLDRLTHQTGLDIIINTSNSWEDWKLALQLVNKGGTIVNVGFPGRDETLPAFNPLDPQYVYVKNIVIKSLSHLTEKDCEYYDTRFNLRLNLTYILSLIKQNRLPADELISSEIAYTDLRTLYDRYLNKNSSLFTSIINWR